MRRDEKKQVKNNNKIKWSGKKKFIPEGWKLLVNRNSFIKHYFKKTSVAVPQGKQFQEAISFENFISPQKRALENAYQPTAYRRTTNN